MDVALNKNTERLIASEELWEQEEVDKDLYCCPDCLIPLIPASYLKSNKRRPYFRYLSATPHKVDCAYNENSKLIKIAQSESISNEDGFPFPYPSKLIIDNGNSSDATAGGFETPVVKQTRNKTRGNTSGDIKSNHHRTVSTIKNIVRHYVCFPNDLHVGLTVPYVSADQTTYNAIFKNIWGGDVYNNYHIFFSKIFWNKPELFDDYIEVKLMAGEWDNKVQTKACRLRINLDSSKERQRGLILREIRTTVQETIDNKDKVWGYIFFLGKQDDDDKYLFHTDSHKFISCLTISKNAKL